MITGGLTDCCTGKVFFHFENGQEWHGKQAENQDVKDRIWNEVVENLNHSKRAGNAVIVATTTQFQTNAEKILEELGFYCIPGDKKKLHPKTIVTTWVMPLNEWEPKDFPLRKVNAYKPAW